MTIQDVLDALNAERYGPSLWWKRPDPSDDPVAVKVRQMLLAEVCEEDEESPAVEPDSRLRAVDLAQENGPRDGAQTPSQSRGLTDYEGVG